MDDLKFIKEIVESVFETKIIPRRHALTIKAKSAYARLALIYTNKTLYQIAKEIGLTNHASTYNLINKVFPVELSIDATFEGKFEECVNLIEEKGLFPIESKKAVEKELELAEIMLEKWQKRIPRLKRKLAELN